jgi:3-deoxy-D-manno-octulosonate 8-phosphate phosphatase (KDO 8-P phosphatase)
VDGVLTDGTVALDDLGHETKRFNAKDGLGIAIWRRMGGEVAVITGRAGQAVRHRLEELGVRQLHSGTSDKAAALRAVAAAVGVAPEAIAFVGDDLPDLPAMRACGYPVAVHDAAAEVRAAAAYVTAAPEVVEHLLRSQDRWNDALAMFDAPSDASRSAGRADERPRST